MAKVCKKGCKFDRPEAGLIQVSMKKDVEMRGIEPRAFHMQSERSTTELHPQWH